MQESTKAEQMEQGDKSKDFPESGECEWSQRILKDSTRIIIEQSVEMRSRLYMLFVDFQVAFDSLNRRIYTTANQRNPSSLCYRWDKSASYRQFNFLLC